MPNPESADRVTCPECGWNYPAGTIVSAGEILDPLVESSGPLASSHPSACPRSERPTTSSGTQGAYQQIPFNIPIPAITRHQIVGTRELEGLHQ